MNRAITFTIFCLILVACSSYKQTATRTQNQKYIVGYLFPGDSLVNPNEIAVKRLTHIIYAFANIKDGKIEQGFKNDVENFIILNRLKRKNPNLKILISVGGWTWSGGFSDMALTMNSRVKFINSAIAFIEKNHLDGIDIDWEFPGLEGDHNPHRPEDKQNFTALLRELRRALDQAGAKVGKHYLLTAATSTFDAYLAHTEMGKDQKYLDFMNLMGYDFSEPDADSIAGLNAPLFTDPRDPNHNSANDMVIKYEAAGVPANKIVLGVPFYGHVWKVSSTDHNGLFEPGGQPRQRISGSFKNIEQNLLNKNGFIRYWDSTASVPYLFNRQDSIFISYDDQQSLSAKCRYINDHHLKGAMFWRYGSDYQTKLLTTLYEGLR